MSFKCLTEVETKELEAQTTEHVIWIQEKFLLFLAEADAEIQKELLLTPFGGKIDPRKYAAQTLSSGCSSALMAFAARANVTISL